MRIHQVSTSIEEPKVQTAATNTAYKTVSTVLPDSIYDETDGNGQAAGSNEEEPV
jgi:hypothetical protein